MSNIMVRGGSSAGHCFGPMPFLNGSENVLINGIPVARLGDGYNSGSHTCGNSSHAIGSASSGFKKVLVNGRPIHRINDSVSCGDSAGTTPARKVFTKPAPD